MLSEMMTLREILSNVKSLPWNQSLYLPSDRNWTLESIVLVWDQDDIDQDEPIPLCAAKLNLVYGIGISSLQDIESNLAQQKSSYSIENLFNAFLYFMENDAFVKLQS
jgi:hypothetical protein